MNNLCKKLMLGGSSAALFAVMSAGAVYAQENDNETVVVSASRIAIQGYQAPTPVTVIGAQQLNRDAHTDIGDSIRELPSVGASDSPNNGSHSGNAAQGDAGVDTINLRNLGTVRTLVLFDGQRMVTSVPQAQEGGYDLGTMPSTLVSRIDVVTGGASAAWGSDAVAGVVNLVLNKTFTGVKANLNLGDSYKDDHRTAKAELTVGTTFDGDRGHFILAGTYTTSPNAVFANNRPWFWGQTTLFNGPTGGPARITVSGQGVSNKTQGGLITASAVGTGVVGVNGVTALAAANALAGIQFIGPNAQAVPFYFGTVSKFQSACINCSANLLTATSNANLISVPYHNFTLFNYTSYDITPSIKASLQLNYSQNYEENYANAARASTYTIKADNAFIPASVAAQMKAGGIASFTLGTDTMNNRDPNNITVSGLNGFAATLGQNNVINQRQFMREVATLEGSVGLLGQDWSWNTYIEHSSVRTRQKLPDNTINGGNVNLYNNFNNAIDAVISPTTGGIVCRSTLTNPTNGCVPLDLFGTGTVSQAALNYVAPGRLNPAIEDQVTFLLNQTVVSGSAQGTLPWGLPAGKIALAFGGEYRLEQQRNIADPLGLGGDKSATVGGTALWESGNFVSWAGQYNVVEGFAEVDVPILKDTIVQSLDFNAAGRLTSYSTSGLVETWKLGLTSQVTDDLRLRTTMSADIRAPDVAELFAPQNFSTSPFSDFKNGNQTVSIHFSQGGNPNLLPEQAITVSGGVVLTPHWIENLTLSMDWYAISIHKAIFSTAVVSNLAQCAAGNTTFCSSVFFAQGIDASSTALKEVDGNGVVQGAGFPLFSAASANALNFVEQLSLNAASETASGLDFQGDYRMELFSGVLDWHLVGNYTDERTRTNLGVTVDGAGQLGGDAPTGLTTAPKFHMTLAASYGDGPYEFTIQGRYLGTARLVNTWVTGVDVDNNNVPDVAYMDLRASYKWTDKIQFYGAIDNTFNTPPPNIPSTTGWGPALLIYDGLGRAFRLGVRFAD